MRKKLFAILMSAMMMVTFMPAMAFALPDASAVVDGHHYSFDVGANGYVVGNWSAVKAASQDPDAHVTIKKAPTHDADGLIEMRCIEYHDNIGDWACKDTIEAKVFKLGHDWNWKDCENVRVSVDELVDAVVAEGLISDVLGARAKVYFNEKYCYGKAWKCSCGKIYVGANRLSSSVDTLAELETELVASEILVAHKAPSTKTCAKTVKCMNCGKSFATPETSTVAHDTTGVTTSTKKVGCNGITLTVANCKNCGVEQILETAGSANCNKFVKDVSASIQLVNHEGDSNCWDMYEGSVHDAAHKVGHLRKDKGLTDQIADSYKVYLVTGLGGVQVTVYKADTEVKEGANYYYGFTCADCGYVVKGNSKQHTVAPCVHTWTTKTAAATCTAKAYDYKVCSLCGEFKTASGSTPVFKKGNLEITEKANSELGHDYVVESVAATCVTPAYTKITCSRCNELEIIDQADSRFETAKTFLWTGFNYELIGTNDKIKIDQPTASKGAHTYTTKVVLKEATCANGTIEGYVCDVCGKTCMHGEYKPQVVAGTQLAHTAKKVVVAPTCGDEGYSYNVCSVCDAYLDEAGTSESDIKVKFDRVNPVVKEDADCTFDAWKVVKEATIFEEGIKDIACSKCGKVKGYGDAAAIAKKSYAAPKVSVKKGKVVVTVAAQNGAVKYVIKAGKKTKTVTAAGKVTLKKVAKKGKKVKVTVTAYNAAGAKVVSKAKTVKAK